MDIVEYIAVLEGMLGDLAFYYETLENGLRRTVIILSGEADWVPASWRQHYEQTVEELELAIFMDFINHGGFDGIITFNELEPPEYNDYLLCPYCERFLVTDPVDLAPHELFCINQ
jgi:hypothetical protein